MHACMWLIHGSGYTHYYFHHDIQLSFCSFVSSHTHLFMFDPVAMAAIPVISQQQDLQTAALGSPTTLSCDTYGSPQPQITWVKKDGELPVYVQLHPALLKTTF